MDILKILSGIKGKVLDSHHFDLLKHAYELQEQNLEQMRHNNSVIRESNELLKDKVASLEKANEKLASRVEELSRLAPGREGKRELSELSEVATSILDVYVFADEVTLDDTVIRSRVKCNAIQAKAGLDELVTAGFIKLSGGSPSGLRFGLTPYGRGKLANKG